VPHADQARRARARQILSKDAAPGQMIASTSRRHASTPRAAEVLADLGLLDDGSAPDPVLDRLLH